MLSKIKFKYPFSVTAKSEGIARRRTSKFTHTLAVTTSTPISILNHQKITDKDSNANPIKALLLSQATYPISFMAG